MNHIKRLLPILLLMAAVWLTAVSCGEDHPAEQPTASTETDISTPAPTEAEVSTEIEAPTETDAPTEAESQTETPTEAPTEAETPDNALPLAYEFTGDEQARPGYAEGTVTYTVPDGETDR